MIDVFDYRMKVECTEKNWLKRRSDAASSEKKSVCLGSFAWLLRRRISGLLLPAVKVHGVKEKHTREHLFG